MSNRTQSQGQKSPSFEAYPSCRFYVELKHIPLAVFTEVGGLQIETEVMDYAQGGNNSYIHRLPGATKFSNLTLKRGMAASNELFTWYMEVAQGQITRHNIAVIMYDVAGAQLVRWEFLEAYPVKWIGPQLSASANTVAIETLELAHHGIKVV